VIWKLKFANVHGSPLSVHFVQRVLYFFMHFFYHSFRSLFSLDELGMTFHLCGALGMFKSCALWVGAVLTRAFIVWNWRTNGRRHHTIKWKIHPFGMV